METHEVWQKLRDAIETGEVLNVIYHGGSEPGKARQLLPRKLDGDKVMALCLTTNRVKGFLIEKIEISATDVRDYTGEHKQPEEPNSFRDGIAPYLDELNNLGWVIELDDFGIALYQQLKNGKRRKHPAIALINRPEEINKPWQTCGYTFKYFARTLDRFLTEARKQAPNSKV